MGFCLSIISTNECLHEQEHNEHKLNCDVSIKLGFNNTRTYFVVYSTKLAKIFNSMRLHLVAFWHKNIRPWIRI